MSIRTITLTTALFLASATATSGELGVFQSDQNGFDTKTYWYDDGHEITVFDTQFVPALTEAMVVEIRKKSPRPITRAVVTHPNPDKFNGLSVFHKLGATSIASKATAEAMANVNNYKRYFWIEIAKAFTEESYPTFEPVKETFSNQFTITLASKETITLIELKNSGVSSTQTVARIDATGDLIVGDLVHHNAHVWLEGGIVDSKPKPNLKAWISALDELTLLKGKIVHGGRGDSGPVEQVVTAQQEYLRGIDQLVDQYLEELGPKKSELLNPTTAQTHYKALQTRAAEKFPRHRLAYLVGYGVYGLINSRLAQ